jgi:hypothetical protein
VKVLLNPDSNATPSPTTIKGHILKVLQVSVNTAIGMVRRSKSKPATAAAENGVTAEVEGKSSAAATSGKSSFSIMRLISKLREINSAPADDDEYADEAPIKAEEKSEPEKARSPFGIMEFIGKFISVKKSDESSSKSDDDEDHDGLLATIAAEINKEESDTDDDDVADAIARAESEIPEDLKEAQARAEDESKPGLVSGLLARFMPGQKAQQESDEDVIAEMSDDEAEAPGGLASLVGMLISRIRKSDDVAVEESKAVAASDDARPAASSVDKPEETETESDETTAEVSVDNADEGTEATDPVSESGEEAGADAGEPADGAESEVPADADAESEDTVAAKAADSPVDVDSPESNAIEIDDPQKALDHSVARASLEVEQHKAESDRLLGVYAVSVDKSKEEFGTVTPETIGYEIARTERLAARRLELEERRSEVEGLKQSVATAQVDVSSRQDKTAETSGGVTHAQEGWQEWLFGVDLDPEMSVAQVRRVVDTLEPIRSQVTACEELEGSSCAAV